MKRILLISLVFLTGSGPVGSAETETPVDLKAAHLDGPHDADGWVRLGNLYYAEDRLGDARDAFKKAITHSDSASGYYGLALVYQKQCVQNKPFRCGRVESNLKKAIKRDETFADAILALAEWYGNGDHHDKVFELLDRYLELRPNDPDGLYALTRAYSNGMDFASALEIGATALDDFPDDPRWLPMVAQAYLAEGESARSLKLFMQYLETLPGEERAHYEDLAPIAKAGELDEVEDLSATESVEFYEDFWSGRDPSGNLDAKATRAEFYRRVWFARTHFSDATQPWDRRGDVYVLLGHPHYRARSDRTNPIPDLEVQMIKDRRANEIYGGGWEVGLERQGALSSRDAIESELGISYPNGSAPVFPLSAAAGGIRTSWESWVYTTVGRGIEVVFTDETGNGRYDLAPASEVPGRGFKDNDILHSAAFFHRY